MSVYPLAAGIRCCNPVNKCQKILRFAQNDMVKIALYVNLTMSSYLSGGNPARKWTLPSPAQILSKDRKNHTQLRTGTVPLLRPAQSAAHQQRPRKRVPRPEPALTLYHGSDGSGETHHPARGSLGTDPSPWLAAWHGQCLVPRWPRRVLSGAATSSPTPCSI